MIINDYEYINHGVENSDYFQGCGTAFTDFDNVCTGIGDTLYEAIDDCLEQICTINDIDNVDEIEKEIKDKNVDESMEITYDEDSGEDDGEFLNDVHYYVSIRYNIK